MECPGYLAQGWRIGSGAVEGACKAAVGRRLKPAGMRRGEDGADAVCLPRALDRGEEGRWEAIGAGDHSPAERLTHQLYFSRLRVEDCLRGASDAGSSSDSASLILSPATAMIHIDFTPEQIDALHHQRFH